MKVFITGASGFIGKNLTVRLKERGDLQLVFYNREDGHRSLGQLLEDVDCIFHLSGVNRPVNERDFKVHNSEFTRDLCEAVRRVTKKTLKPVKIIFASSTQATQNTAYGVSKRLSEEYLKQINDNSLVNVYSFRLNNVFGKWSRPNYNSVVATFCHNIARNIPITIHDPDAVVRLTYIDDVIEGFFNVMDNNGPSLDKHIYNKIEPIYTSTVGELAQQILKFKGSRESLLTERVGTDLARALYATYVSFLPVELVGYEIPAYADARGSFIEMMKTPDCGQFSVFTAPPGVTRGGHYHHTKTEKFLVVKGFAQFRFRNIIDQQTYQIEVSADEHKVVETLPGWAHDITNIGEDEIVVILWANEVFNKDRPDTFKSHT